MGLEYSLQNSREPEKRIGQNPKPFLTLFNMLNFVVRCC